MTDAGGGLISVTPVWVPTYKKIKRRKNGPVQFPIQRFFSLGASSAEERPTELTEL